MTIEEKEQSLVDFIDVLCDKEYSSNANSLIQSLAQLKSIYSGDFRHSYSSIFYKLQGVFSADFEVSSTLGENLNYLSQYIHDQLVANPDDANLQNVNKGFRKLSDHINLEIGRYNFIKNQLLPTRPFSAVSTPESDDSDVQAQVNSIQDGLEAQGKVIEKQGKEIENIKPVVTQAQSAVDKVDSKLEANKISSITALTIFSAVILAFSGGISFESSVFNSISQATPYRLIFVVSLTGFILFNTIFALLYIVGKMSGKSISSRCKYLSIKDSTTNACRSCGDGYCTKQCSPVSLACKIWHKYSYVFAINMVLLGLMYCDYITWAFQPRVPFISYRWNENFFLIFPMVAFFLLLISNQISKSIQRKRIFLSVKCDIVSRYFNPKEPLGIFASFAVFRNIFGQHTKSYEEELSSIIKNSGATKRESKINDFVEEKMMTTEALAQTVSYGQNRKNKKKWKTLKEQIQNLNFSSTEDA